jgi:dihydrofolate reductase
MRKIVAGEFVTIDGVMESPDKWHFPYWSDEMGAVVGEQMANTDAMLLGRVTFQEFATFWPSQTESEVPGAGHMNDTQKYVVSSTLDDVSAWQNSTLITGDVAGEIAKLKEQPGKDIGVTGSATLVQWLLREGLLDELHLLVHPISLGSGKRILDEKAGRVPLKLVEFRNLPNDVLYLIYAPDRSAAEGEGAAGDGA